MMARKRKVATKPRVEEKIDNGVRSRTKGSKSIETRDDIELDAEDEFHSGRDKVLLEGAAGDYDQDTSDSEEEVFGLEGLEDEDENEGHDEEDFDEGDDQDETGADLNAESMYQQDSDDDGEQSEDLDAPVKSWGRNKQIYYNADDIQDSDDAKEEEVEALRLQQEALKKMDDSDFVDDSALNHWKETTTTETMSTSFGENVLREQLKRELPKDLSRNDVILWLEMNAPDLLDLVEDFDEKTETLSELSLQLPEARNDKVAPSQFKILKTQYAVLSSYLTNVAFYFSLRSSGIDTVNHPVVKMIQDLKAAWSKLEMVEVDLTPLPSTVEMLVAEESDSGEDIPIVPVKVKSKKRKMRETEPVVEYEEAFVSRKPTKKARLKLATSDFGDPTALEDVDAEDKAARKRSLRFYTARIDQKSAMRAKKAGTGGDDDIPYRDRRERERRQAKEALDAQANADADLDGADFTEADAREARSIVRDDTVEDDDGYYDLIKSKSAITKQAKKEAYEAAKRGEVVLDDETADGKRAIGYTISKNKGLTPRRRKEVRNPRVKKRMKYDKAKKKLSSTRAVYKGDHGGNYSGETTGIKTGVSKSVRF